MVRLSQLLFALCAACAFAPASLALDAGGLRHVESKHLTLYTDLPADEEIDSLPAYFDQAFEQWCAYFGVDPARHADWRVRGCLMRAAERFRAAGLLDDKLPAFSIGYSRGDELWLYEQSSAYFRRHLLLHEGTHCFMHAMLGDAGPPWYAEGMAELLATHRLEAGKLVLGDFPEAREAVPKWGRIELVQTAFADRRALTLARIFDFGGTLHGAVETYGWCWAAAAFLDGHPRYRQRFRRLPAYLDRPGFERAVEAAFASDRVRLDEDWRLFVANIDYGYDFERMEVEHVAGQPLAAEGHTVSIAADRGWQASGVRLERGKTYHLQASGRYVVAREADGTPWTSEPGGVTIRYANGQPLGILLAAIRSDDAGQDASSGLIRPRVVGLEATIEPRQSGTLYLRINDSAGALHDNSGTATVEIHHRSGDSLSH